MSSGGVQSRSSTTAAAKHFPSLPSPARGSPLSGRRLAHRPAMEWQRCHRIYRRTSSPQISKLIPQTNVLRIPGWDPMSLTPVAPRGRCSSDRSRFGKTRSPNRYLKLFYLIDSAEKLSRWSAVRSVRVRKKRINQTINAASALTPQPFTFRARVRWTVPAFRRRSCGLPSMDATKSTWLEIIQEFY